jgi:serine acetyltransferase
MKKFFLRLWMIESQIRLHITISKMVGRIPKLGHYLAMILDRILLIIYGIDLESRSIAIHALSISHPSGVLLGGNGIISTGRIVVMSGVKFAGRSPDDPDYIERHKNGNVFILGDNVVISAGTVIIGPITICDNVLIGAMSLVNKNITEPGVYVGIPVKKISNDVSDQWVKHLPPPQNP